MSAFTAVLAVLSTQPIADQYRQVREGRRLLEEREKELEREIAQAQRRGVLGPITVVGAFRQDAPGLENPTPILERDDSESTQMSLPLPATPGITSDNIRYCRCGHFLVEHARDAFCYECEKTCMGDPT